LAACKRDLTGKVRSYDKAIEFKPDFHEAWYNRGVALGNLGLIEDAIASYDKALEIKIDFHQAWLNRGIAAGNSDSCNQLLASLSSIARQNPHLNQRGYNGKLASYEEGLKYCLQDTHPEGWGLLHQYIGNAHYYQGRGNSYPRDYWYKAVKSYNEALKTLTAADFPELHLEVLRDLIRVQLDLGETAKAEELQRSGTDLLRRLLSEPNRSEYSKKQLALKFAGFQQLTVDLAVQSGDLVQAVELAEQGKNACLSWLLDAWSDEISSPSYSQMQNLLSPTTAIVYWHISPAALHTFILKHNAPSPIVLGETEFLSQSQRLREFENWVTKWNEQYADYRKGKDKQGEEERTWRNNLPTMLRNLGNILDIPAIIEFIQNPIPPTPLKKGGSKIQNLILVPHRDLHRFPLHALFADDFTITYLPSTKIGITFQQQASGEQDTATQGRGDAGNINETLSASPRLPFSASSSLSASSLLSIEHPNSTGYPSLEFAQVESEAISRMFPNPTRKRSDEATHEALITALPQGYSIFHFTGHGAYNFQNPALSYLALAGEEKLTLADIHDFDLRSYKLVSLAACETAITGNHTITTEYVGLVSGFMGCGVAHVVSTLWTVESAASALVMMQFYQLLQQGKAEAVALAEATQWLRNVTNAELAEWYAAQIAKLSENEDIVRRFLSRHLDNIKNTTELNNQPYNHPYFWAAFTITGTFPSCNQ
jgi:CHAT domain-containing protein